MNYSEIITDLENKLFSLHPKAKELYTLIAGLKNFQFEDVSADNQKSGKLVYDKNAPVSKKIIFALRYIDRFSKVGDIENTIKEFEPDFDKGFSTPLRILKDDKVIEAVTPTGSKRDVYYGLKEWYEADGSIKEKYDLFSILE